MKLKTVKNRTKKTKTVFLRGSIKMIKLTARLIKGKKTEKRQIINIRNERRILNFDAIYIKRTVKKYFE